MAVHVYEGYRKDVWEQKRNVGLEFMEIRFGTDMKHQFGRIKGNNQSRE